MGPLIRLEYIDAAIEKAPDAYQQSALCNIRELLAEYGRLDQEAPKRYLENRIRSGEDPAKVGAPGWAASMSQSAADDVHKLQSRICRRAPSAAAVIESLLNLLEQDIDRLRSNLQSKHIIEANKEVDKEMLEAARALQDGMREFVARFG